MSRLFLILVLVGILLYLPALFGPFIWDDDFVIVNNPRIHSPFSSLGYFMSPSLTSGNGGITEGFYRPFTYLYFALIYQISSGPFLFHFFQIALHLLNVILIFHLYSKVLRPGVSFILSLIFLVHPLNVEAVAYISASPDLLSFTFGILALLLIFKIPYLTFRRLFFFSLLLLASLLTRESGIVFVIISLGYFLLSPRDAFPKIFAFISVPVIFYLFLRLGVAHIYFFTKAVAPIMLAPLSVRLLNVPAILLFYLKTLFFPAELSIARSWVIHSPTLANFIIPLSIVVLISLVWFFLYSKIISENKSLLKEYLLFSIWLVFGLGIFLQIVPLDFTVSERWFYTPFIGALGLVGLFLSHYHLPAGQKSAAIFLCVVALVLLSGRTLVRILNWSGRMTLYSHDVIISSESSGLHTNLGVEFIKLNRLSEAKQHLETSISLSRYNFTNYNDLGIIYQREGNDDLAITYFNKSITEYSQNYPAYQNLSTLYISNRDWSHAEATLKKAISVFPDSVQFWTYLIKIQASHGQPGEAFQTAKQALRIQPSSYLEDLYFRLLNNEPLPD